MFVHLHIRSWFSFLSGGSSPEALAARATALGMSALGLTDRDGVYGAVRFQKACREVGIRSIIGSEIAVNGLPLVLIATSSRGYGNLCRLITAAHETSRDVPGITLEQLAVHADDLICLSGGRSGFPYAMIGSGRAQRTGGWLIRLQEIFRDRLYVELTHYLRPNDSAINAKLYELAGQLKIPVVATGDVTHAVQEDYSRLDLLTCIRYGITVFDSHPKRPVNGESYLKSEGQLRRLIPYPEAFENTVGIAHLCSVDLLPGYVIPPEAMLPEGATARDRLAELCVDSLTGRYGADELERACSQLRKEIEVISSLALEEYFLVVHEVVSEARRRGIRCAGRGSAANSIVAYLLGITGVDPLRHRLLFERFLHGGRKGTPDIDVDFDSERREEIIAWMEERFGIEQTAMTANIITYRLRMALRDVATALGWSREQVDAVAALVPHRGTAQVREYRGEIVSVLGESPLVERLLDMVESLDRCPRHLGQHNGGMLLARGSLLQFTPVQRSANGVRVAQFNKDDVEAMGLIKFDVLGLRMLSTVSEAVELVRRHEGSDRDIDNLVLDDEETFQLIRSGRTIGVFQIESMGQMHLLAKNRPETFNDLITEVALFRPGPVQSGMVNPFVRRRRGEEPVRFDHPLLVPILEDTYGVILFQEQVLEIAHVFAGMSLEEADEFRRLMSKFRDPGDMESMRGKFVAGAVGHGVSIECAERVFDQLAHFVGYGFCRSHAAAFALTVYQSAWLKAHHPAAFMASVMQHRPGMYSLLTLEEEARRFGVAVLLPDINISSIRYDLERVARDGELSALAIRKPLTAVANLNEESARQIIMARLDGVFVSVEDLYRRVAIERDVLESLARSGALDRLAGSSRRALWEIGVLARRLGPAGSEREAELIVLPAITAEDIPELPALTPAERLAWDSATQGASRRHPMILLRRTLNDLEIRTIATCRGFGGESMPVVDGRKPVLMVAGLAVLRQMPPTAKGVMFVTLEDETGYIQCIVTLDVQARYPVLFRAAGLVVRGVVENVGEWRGLVVVRGWSLEEMMGKERSTHEPDRDGHSNLVHGDPAGEQLPGTVALHENHPRHSER